MRPLWGRNVRGSSAYRRASTACPPTLVLIQHKLLAGGDAELPLDEVETGQLLGDGMLDLDAGVELEEEQLAARDEEFGCTRAAVADRRCERDGRLAETTSRRLGETGRGRLFQHLLVAALHRAVPQPDRQRRSVRIGEQLRLDMPRTVEEPLAEDAPVAERGYRFARCCLERVVELGRLAHDAHAATPATGRRLDDEREADLLRLPGRQRRHARLDGDPLRRDLVAAEPEHV